MKSTNSKDRLLEIITQIVTRENRPVSYKDLSAFEWNGQIVKYGYQPLRNLISQLSKEGKIYTVYRSPQSFYAPTGVSFGRASTSPSIYVLKPQLSSKQKSFLKFLKISELKYPAIHDIRLNFVYKGLHELLLKADSNLIISKDDLFNKNITLKDITYDDITLKIIIHNTDKVSVIVSCSDNPIPLDYFGISNLSSMLTRVEERLYQLIHHYPNDLFESNVTITDNISPPIPFHMDWIVTMWHFGHDSEQGFTGEQFEITYKEGLEVIRIYSKKNLT